MIESTTRNSETVLTYDVAADERVSEAVVAAVTSASNADPAEMDPLAETVDPDALFADRYDGTPRSGGDTRFPFFGYEVVVTGDSLVSIRGPTR